MLLRTAGLSFESKASFSYVTDETEPCSYDEFLFSAQVWLDSRGIRLGEGLIRTSITQMFGIDGTVLGEDVMEYRIDAPRISGPYPITDEVCFAGNI